MASFNYFMTPVGPEYKKKLARNVGIVLLILFSFYGLYLVMTIPDGNDSLDVAMMGEGSVILKPADMCASIALSRLSQDEMKRFEEGEKETVFFELSENELDELPVLDELIRATHLLEFPKNSHATIEIPLNELVNYEFFLMEKSIAKYGDARESYFSKLDSDLEQRLEDPNKQGFSNFFESPILEYREKMYMLGGTTFWTSDEHEPARIGVSTRDNLTKNERFITLSDEDMQAIPKIKHAIEKIGTEDEQVTAFKGLPENPDWNQYREWYEKKISAYDLDSVLVQGFVYKGEHYTIGFAIC